MRGREVMDYKYHPGEKRMDLITNRMILVTFCSVVLVKVTKQLSSFLQSQIHISYIQYLLMITGDTSLHLQLISYMKTIIFCNKDFRILSV